ncbi:MAG: hypothetical protein G01um101416_393 [Microgenomates group bacterium Gr01-1014_16]|nr:MAG: hypothetical protein G01um101416_393 [Microgenomates group bacterium Gr01-1014_16]
MILLIFFAFLAGFVTILSPCILPVLPVVLSGSVGGGKRRPFGIVAGFVASFTFFTLFLSFLVKATGISADSLRLLSVIVIFSFGLSLILPGFQAFIEKLFARLLQLKSTDREGFTGGLILGLGLGLLWTPCVGPILASVISLALTGSVNFTALGITLAYSLGTAIPMFIVIYTGRQILGRLQPYSTLIQKTFGVIMIATALALYLNLDRKLQTYILQTFPNYGVGLTRLEDNPLVQKQLGQLRTTPMPKSKIGQPMNEFLPAVLPNYGPAPELIPGGQWFNSQPLKLSDLKGKVILIDFWTYTCINCIRTLPYLKSWDEKYRDKGLVIIGVHTPEFEFEKNPANVQKAITDFGLKYPVMQDNDYATWNAYQNRYWPAKYLIDKDGRIRYTHFGEGEYDATEKTIQQLLAVDMPVANPVYQISTRTPELYIGSSRYQSGFIEFTGQWKNFEEYRQGTPPTAQLTLDFNAKDVYLVMGPQRSYGEIKLELDDQPVSSQFAGADVKDGSVQVVSQRAYHLIHLPQSAKHTLKITVTDVFSIEFFAFTFG